MSDVLHRRVAMLEAAVMRLERALTRTERLARSPVALARSTAASVDSGPTQTNQGRLDAVSLRDGMPTLYHYGYSASLPVGSDKVVLRLGGDPSQSIVVASGHQTYRLTGLATGEVALYDMWGHSIVLGAAGIKVSGDLHVTGSVIAGYGTSDSVSLGTHKHQNDSHGDSQNPPIPGT